MDEDTALLLGGYLTAPRAVRHSWLSSQLLPPLLISISGCLTGMDHGPEFWAWHTDPVAAACSDGVLLAIGFHTVDAPSLIAEVTADCGARPPSTEVPDSLRLLAAASPMPPHAQLRGFEVIGVEYALSSLHSWLCHSYETEVADTLGIRPNEWGLLGTYQQARTVLEWMTDLPADQAPEPVYWTVAAIAECGSGPSNGSGRCDGDHQRC